MRIMFEETPSPPPSEEVMQHRTMYMDENNNNNSDDVNNDDEEERRPTYKRPRVTRELLYGAAYMDTPLTPASPVKHENEDELQRLKGLVVKLENAYKDAQYRNQIIESNYQKKSLDHDELVERIMGEKKEADAKAIYHYTRSQDALKSLELIKNEHTNVVERLQTKIQEMESRNSRLSSDLLSEQRRREKATMELQTNQTEWTNRVHQLEGTVKVLQQQVELQQTSIAQGVEREAEVTQRWKACDARLQELNDAKFDTEAITAFDRQIQLQDDTRKVEMENYRLKSDLKHYKEMCHNVEMLREEKYSLESRVRNMDQLMAENMRLDILNARLQAEKLEWAGYLEKEDGLGYETPQGLIYNLTKEREEARLAMDQITLVKSELENRDKLIRELESHIDELKRLIGDKDRTHRASILAMELLEKDMALLKEHVAVLENQFKLYDIEEANYMEGNYDAQKTQRIQQLEALLKGFEERLSTQAQEIIQSQMQAGDPSTISVPTGPYLQLASGQSIHDFMSNLFNEKETQKQELESFQLKVRSQDNAMNTLQERVQLLEDLIRRHEMDPHPALTSVDTTIEDNSSNQKQPDVGDFKIVSLKNNPEAVDYLEQQLEKLRKENDLLLQPLLLLQRQQQQHTSEELAVDSMDTAGDQTGDVMTIPTCTLENLQYRIGELEGLVKKKDKRITRLIQVFQKQVADLKALMSSIFGYQVQMDMTGRNVQLIPNFVDGKDLHFGITRQKGDRSVVEVLGRNKDAYAKTLEEGYNTFVLDQNYIPGFLSYVTLDFNERHTRMTAQHEDDGQHHYLEENPLTDTLGHELVQPEAIDQEDELDTDFVAEADDSGDNDYVMCVPADEEGYDDDRLAYLEQGDNNNQDEEDYEPNHQNNEIRHQEIAGEATYVANDTDNSDLLSDEDDDHQHYESYEEDDEDEVDDMEEDEESDDSGSGEDQPVTGQESNPISLDDDDD